MSFQTQSYLTSHIQEKHSFPCNVCGVMNTSSESLTQHVADNHNQAEETTDNYQCEHCNFEDVSLSVIVEHVILSHSRQVGGKFCCENCMFKGDSRKVLLEHFKAQHMVDINKQDIPEDSATAGEIAENYRQLKSNFERLNHLFKERQEEFDKEKIDLTSRLNEATEKYTVLMIENEELKEKLDILFRLSRSYLDSRNDGEIEVLQTSDDDNINDQIDTRDTTSKREINEQSWEKQKLRGFRKVQKTSTLKTPPESHIPHRKSETENIINRNLIRLASSNSFQPTRSHNSENRRFCHYYTNFGYCHYEEQTNRRCRYEHKIAPMCSDGDDCTRTKCMYSHPNKDAQPENSFLQRSRTRVPLPIHRDGHPLPQISRLNRSSLNQQQLSQLQNVYPQRLHGASMRN